MTSEAPQDVAALLQTEAGKRLHGGHCRYPAKCDYLAAILAIEREAAARLLDQNDRLRSALEWAMAPNPRYEGRHRTEPRCAEFMPTDSDCDCGYAAARSVLRGSGAEEAAR